MKESEKPMRERERERACRISLSRSGDGNDEICDRGQVSCLRDRRGRRHRN